MENARILIYGTGTVGIHFGGKLAKAGYNVTFVDREERAELLNQSGLELVGLEGSHQWEPTVYSAVDQLDPQDLILICVKAIHTYDIALNLLPVIKPSTAILSFQNGLENEAILADLLGKNLILGTVLQFHGHLENNCRSIQEAPAQVIYGELDHQPSGREEWLSEIFSKADIDHVISHNINQKSWEHFLWNSAYNSIGALTATTLQDMIEHEPLRPTIEQMIQEGVGVANAEGVEVSTAAIEEISKIQVRFSHIRPAMLQDIEAGRRPELEPLLGVLLKKAKRGGISMPVTSTIYNLLQLVCSKFDSEEA
ncbi:MAG: ketopantoate reductase family protein [bacterium]|nr:ketopantoate reductase family protein [bacterium]